MTLKQFRNKPVIKIITNKYVLIIATFIIWMVFFDENSILMHREFNKEIDKLNSEKEYYNSLDEIRFAKFKKGWNNRANKY